MIFDLDALIGSTSGLLKLLLFVAITTIAVGTGQMRSSTSAALVGAAILSTLIFPLVAMQLRAGRVEGDVDPAVEARRIEAGFIDAAATS